MSRLSWKWTAEVITLKVENYERVHGLGSFPRVCKLDPESGRQLLDALKKVLSIPPSGSGLDCAQSVQQQSVTVGHLGEGGAFAFRDLTAGLALAPSEHVYLNWRHFEDLVEIRFEDLLRHFEDIWYPSSDDLDILDPELRWLISVSHYGAVSALRFDRASTERASLGGQQGALGIDG